MPVSRPRRHSPTGRWALLLGAVLLLIALGVGMALRGGVYSIGGAVPAPTATIDPRLIISARTVPIIGVLTQGVQVQGTLYPAYPGRNTLRVVFRQRGRVLSPSAPVVLSPSAPVVLSPSAPVVLTLTMPGMAMAPIHARLTGRASRYAGVVNLPMFGAYRAQVSVATPNGDVTGAMFLSLSLPHL